jgi:hypothetical protein
MVINYTPSVLTTSEVINLPLVPATARGHYVPSPIAKSVTKPTSEKVKRTYLVNGIEYPSIAKAIASVDTTIARGTLGHDKAWNAIYRGTILGCDFAYAGNNYQMISH